MGLDMYLSARISAYQPYNNEVTKERIALEMAATALGLSADHGSISLTCGVAYWRKANQIHAWFVKNVQDGNDDCSEYDVSREQLIELRNVCKRVLKASNLVDADIVNGYTYGADGEKMPMMEKGKTIEDAALAHELLPATSGFFFGSTDYDQYYYDDVKDTVKMLDKALKTASERVTFSYQSSW